MPAYAPPPDLLAAIKRLSPVQVATLLQQAFGLDQLRELREWLEQVIEEAEDAAGEEGAGA
jgi:hypothetical protein